jgi:hypothetical protein
MGRVSSYAPAAPQHEVPRAVAAGGGADGRAERGGHVTLWGGGQGVAGYDDDGDVEDEEEDEVLIVRRLLLRRS